MDQGATDAACRAACAGAAVQKSGVGLFSCGLFQQMLDPFIHQQAFFHGRWIIQQQPRL